MCLAKTLVKYYSSFELSRTQLFNPIIKFWLWNYKISGMTKCKCILSAWSHTKYQVWNIDKSCICMANYCDKNVMVWHQNIKHEINVRIHILPVTTARRISNSTYLFYVMNTVVISNSYGSFLGVFVFKWWLFIRLCR